MSGHPLNKRDAHSSLFRQTHYNFLLLFDIYSALLYNLFNRILLKVVTLKNIFITGIAGLLGSNIAYLLRDRYNIFGIDKNEVKMDKVSFEMDSALNTYKIEELLVANKIDIFLHCAALVNVDACEKMTAYAELINYQLTENLRRCCSKYGIKFVFISTDAVYSGEKDGLNSEDDTPSPISVYGKTKLMAENVVLEDSSSLVLRTNMYGFNYRNKNSFGEWILQALNSDEELNMFNDIYFSPILVNKLTEIIELAVERDLSGLYNLGCTGSINKYDLGIAIQKAFNIAGIINPTNSDSFNFLAPRTKNMGLDNTKIKKALNIEINDPLADIALFKKLYDSGYPLSLKKGE